LLPRWFPDIPATPLSLPSCRTRTQSAGDAVIAWDKHGRAFFGAESSADPAGSKKGFGDVWVATFDNPEGAALTARDLFRAQS
jgi:hypothetical protein